MSGEITDPGAYKARVREALDVLQNYVGDDGKINATKLTQEIKRLRAENAVLLAERDALRAERDALRGALEKAREALDNAQGNINPERSFADELEAEVSSALEVATAAIDAAMEGEK